MSYCTDCRYLEINYCHYYNQQTDGNEYCAAQDLTRAGWMKAWSKSAKAGYLKNALKTS